MTTKKTEDASASQTTTAAAKPEAKPHYLVRPFKDAGTERQFSSDDDLKDVEAGALANYRAAGLVTTEKPAADKAA